MKKINQGKNSLIGLGAVLLSLSLIAWAKNWSPKPVLESDPLQQDIVFKFENSYLSTTPQNPFFASDNIQKFIKMLSKSKKFLNQNLFLAGNALTEETIQYALCKGFSVTWLKMPSACEKKPEEFEWKKKALTERTLSIIDFDPQSVNNPELTKAIQKACVFLLDSKVKSEEEKQWSQFFHALVEKMPSGSRVWVKLLCTLPPVSEKKKSSFFEKEFKKEIMSMKDFEILQWSDMHSTNYRFVQLEEEKEIWERAKQFQFLMQKK